MLDTLCRTVYNALVSMYVHTLYTFNAVYINYIWLSAPCLLYFSNVILCITAYIISNSPSILRDPTYPHIPRNFSIPSPSPRLWQPLAITLSPRSPINHASMYTCPPLRIPSLAHTYSTGRHKNISCARVGTSIRDVRTPKYRGNGLRCGVYIYTVRRRFLNGPECIA